MNSAMKKASLIFSSITLILSMALSTASYSQRAPLVLFCPDTTAELFTRSIMDSPKHQPYTQLVQLPKASRL